MITQEYKDDSVLVAFRRFCRRRWYSISRAMSNTLTASALLAAGVLCSFPLAAHAQGAWEAPSLLEGTIKISAEELLDLKAEFKDLVIIDARPDADGSLNIEGAIAVSDQALTPHTLTSLAKDKFTPLVIFGADEHSVHSYKAARKAVMLGYGYVFWFRGGLQEWLDKGMPVVKTEK